MKLFSQKDPVQAELEKMKKQEGRFLEKNRERKELFLNRFFIAMPFLTETTAKHIDGMYIINMNIITGAMLPNNSPASVALVVTRFKNMSTAITELPYSLSSTSWNASSIILGNSIRKKIPGFFVAASSSIWAASGISR